MTQIDDALAKATELTNKQRVKAEAALDVFASKLGEALGPWVSDAVAQHLKKRPELVAKIEDGAQLSKTKRELNELLATWPGKTKKFLLKTELMSEKNQSQWAYGPLGMVYSAANELIGEAESFVVEAFGAHTEFKLKRPTDGDFPPSVQNVVQVAWEDFAHEQSNLMELAKQQRVWARKVSEQEATARWESA